MSDFEVLPVGTRARLEALESYALKASGALLSLAGDAPELMTMVAGQSVADPLFCAARIEGKIRNARQRYRHGGGK